MHPQAAQLLNNRTAPASRWTAMDLACVRTESISVVLPALDEEATVGEIIEAIRRDLMSGANQLVDELVVLDSGSSDRTALVAAQAGAKVIHRDEVLPQITAVAGKGEAMWRAVAATTGDIVVFIDADLRSFASYYVTGLLGPLLTEDSAADDNPRSAERVEFVKAFYERPAISVGTGTGTVGGGRVTELVARPLLNLYWPELAGLIQPLAGEYAVRRSLLESLPFPCGYGVDFALIVDALALRGPGVFAQVDLGVRQHRHHNDLRLGRMAAEILQVAHSRLGLASRHDPASKHDPSSPMGASLTQFSRIGTDFEAETHDISSLERPPLKQVSEYASRWLAPTG